MRAFEVMLGDRSVGTIGEEADGRIGFRFSDAYRNAPDRPVLGQRFEDNLERTYRGRRPGELPSFFDNLLPEPAGALRRLIARSAGIDERDDLGLLAVAAADLPGAVTLREAPGGPLPLSPDENGGVESAEIPNGRLHFSLAGLQLKFSMLREAERYVLPGRDRFGDWIVKLSSRQVPGLVENEHAMLEWARAAGFEVPETRLPTAAELEALVDYVEPDIRALALRRYDRSGLRRLHQEDFAQVMGKRPANKYDSTFDDLVAAAVNVLGAEAGEELLARLVLMIATGNADAHLKNWSLLYPDGIRPVLAPLYDQVATIAWPRFDRELAMKIRGLKQFNQITRQLLWSILDDESRASDVIADSVIRLRRAWHEANPAAEMLAEHREALREHWQTVPVLREHGLLS